MRSSWRVAGIAVLCTGIFAGGCGGGDASSSGGMGKLSVSLTDAPVDSATEVVVAFSGIELHHADGKTISIDFSSTKTIDLIKLQNGVTNALTDGAEVPAGDYDWMRLKVLADKNTQGQSYIKLTSGAQYPLWIPSGAETGLKLVRPFTVAQGSTTRLIIDFDLRKSITAPPGQDPNYIMRPALRLIDQLQVGKLTANVDLAALATAQLGAGAAPASCKAGLYVFAGANVVPDDQDGDGTNGAVPVLYQPVAYDGVNAQVPVTIDFLEVGPYTVAATCNFDVDAADTDDYDPNAAQGQPGYQTMHWTVVGNVSITANTTTAVGVP
ncbi:MAG TPA: DUF4382 domain-containing protein [Steroidobacteraceae bacterium]|jgi:hypothetical protein|nr:DUF4382 domain-containing protein [Steroidobacteraceae bacterium]